MNRLPRLVALLPLAVACREPEIIVIPGVNVGLEVVVTNPTDCPVCDPFADIDTLKLEVSMGEEVVASDSFAYPDEAVTLPDLTDFGVVRITLLGLEEGRVISAGRTSEIVLVPGANLSVPLVFVPANRALPLAAPMVEDRYRHVTIRRRDGTVLFVGGLDPMRERATAATEVYDPVTSTFAEAEPYPTSAAAGMATAALPNGATLLAGGFAVINDNSVGVDGAAIFDDTTGTWIEAGSLSVGRSDLCVAMFLERQGLVLGGAPDIGEYLKPDDETGLWSFSALEMRDFDPGAVTDCAALGDGTVYVQGGSAEASGIWAGAEESLDPAEAFTPIVPGSAGEFRYVSGPVFFPTDDAGVRIVGGLDAETGEVYADGRLFSPSTGRYTAIDGFAAPRFDAQVAPWISGDWYAVGCGWADGERAEDEPTVELYDPVAGKASPLFDLDRPRPGCTLSVLADGSILVAGGGEEGSVAGDAAALIVPYVDPTMDAG